MFSSQKAKKEKGGIIRAIKRQYNKGVRMLFHRKGHGVHSPFVFNFIIRVIEEKARYYAYDEIEESYRNAKQQAKKESLPKPLPLKYHKLTYRVTNRFAPKTILELGNNCGVTTKALSLAATNAQITPVSISDVSNFDLLLLKARKMIKAHKILRTAQSIDKEPKSKKYTELIITRAIGKTKEYTLFRPVS